MGYYSKINIDLEVRESITNAKKELGIQSIANCIKKTLTKEELEALKQYLNGN